MQRNTFVEESLRPQLLPAQWLENPQPQILFWNKETGQWKIFTFEIVAP
ncbi:MAG TPA: hypothetical protein VMY18_12280 [Acidobacteriota bacterium]|nr:hypothetical protein [Acidobacteriota bacterium]